MLRGQFRGVSETKMLECLAKLGRDVQIVVGPDRRSEAEGHIEVVFAARRPRAGRPFVQRRLAPGTAPSSCRNGLAFCPV
nr:helix-turn-helix domain-containing protein [Burkholderia cenocepacia]